MPLSLLFTTVITALSASLLYLWHVNTAIMTIPPEAARLFPKRWNVKAIQDTAKRITTNPPNILSRLPPSTGRRYIVVGGTGFVGRWIVRHLLLRGEDPARIRIIARNPPKRNDLLSGKEAEVPFISADVQDRSSIHAAFSAVWPSEIGAEDSGITVFYTTSAVRYYERHPSLLHRSIAVDIDGPRNTLLAAREVGANVFIYTSSPAVGSRNISFWVPPWQKHPIKNMVQITDDATIDSTGILQHKDFPSNYSYAKHLAERLVLDADDAKGGFRTGVLRSGNTIFGYGDIMIAECFKQVVVTDWFAHVITSHNYVENCSYAHLLYEQRLLDALQSPLSSPLNKLGGQAYLITDGQSTVFKDLHLAVSTLTNNRLRFIHIPPVVILVISHLIEAYYLIQTRFLRFLPPISGDVTRLQPSSIAMVTRYIKLDDSKARLSPMEGGIGYEPLWTTLEAVCKTVLEYDHAASTKPA